jgi:hypothetical protein
MARAKSADGPRKPSSGGARWARTLGESLGRALRPLLPLLSLGVLYAALAVGLSWPLKKDPQANLGSQAVLAPMLNAKPRPPYIPESEWRRLAQLGAPFEGRSVFDTGLGAEMARAYESSPWIERVGAVRLHYPATVSIEGVRPRYPFARVETDGGWLVVDRKGYVLPMSAGDLALAGPRPATNAPWVEVPSVLGPHARRTAPGERVTDSEAREGLGLLETAHEILSRSPGALKAVRVQRDPAGTWRVLTAGGPVIEWGYWQDEQRPSGEPCLREKKQWLARRLAEWDAKRLRFIRLDKYEAPVVPLVPATGAAAGRT